MKRIGHEKVMKVLDFGRLLFMTFSHPKAQSGDATGSISA
jgi:hypothetical protein